MQRLRGEITVFLSLILVCVFSLMMGLLESARTAGARLYLQMAADSYGTMYVDDIKVTPLGTAEIPVVEGYNPDADNSAPENSAWMETFQKPPRSFASPSRLLQNLSIDWNRRWGPSSLTGPRRPSPSRPRERNSSRTPA